MNIVIIDDDIALCRTFQLQLEMEGHSIQCFHTGRSALEMGVEPEVAFVDLRLPDMSGLEVLRKLRDRQPGLVSIMITGVQDAKATIDAIRIGAFDYIRKPLDWDSVLLCLEKVSRQLEHTPAKRVPTASEDRAEPNEIVGADPKMIDILKRIALLSANPIPVLITGDSGTGKELVARTIHESSRPKFPFVAINCSAVVPTLLESELFGYVKGSFTGADTKKTGKLTVAGEGTVFLDEIGDMPLDLQAKLLRVLQEREFEPVGGTVALPFRARVIAATHQDLTTMAAMGSFREDLYYRLAVTTIHVPPLRERRGDIPLLAKTLLDRLNRELKGRVSHIEEGALQTLQSYDWPGNVREMVNILTRSILVCKHDTITIEDISDAMKASTVVVPRIGELKTLRDVEREHVGLVLAHTGWNIMKSAEILGISRVTLRKKIQEYSLKK
ncbi:MAG: sigma-54-dependent Fis family transcriptional regulator [Candidatus Hydrogenedentota bacterium]